MLYKLHSSPGDEEHREYLARLYSEIQAGGAAREAAETGLFQFLERRLRMFIYRSVKHYDDTADLIGDVLLEVLKDIRAKVLRDPGALSVYAYRIAHAKICLYFRAKRKERNRLFWNNELWTGHFPVPLQDPTFCVRETLIAKEGELLQHRFIREALGTLRREERELLYRFFTLEQKGPQIRREMGLTLSLYRNRKFQALTKLGRHIHKARADYKAAQQYRRSVLTS